MNTKQTIPDDFAPVEKTKWTFEENTLTWSNNMKFSNRDQPVFRVEAEKHTRSMFTKMNNWFNRKNKQGYLFGRIITPITR